MRGLLVRAAAACVIGVVGAAGLGVGAQPEGAAKATGPANTTLPAAALDAAHKARAQEIAAKAIAYLRGKQDKATGGWNVPPADGKRPAIPAITALVLNGMMMDPSVQDGDEAVVAGVKYILGMRQPDGGIYDRSLASYNTSICLSALAHVDSREARDAIRAGQDFLRRLQWSEGTDPAAGGPEAGKPVNKEHPYYGGIGYGSGQRPDLSNLGFMLEAFHDTGVAADDVAYQRALVFLARCQMNGEINDQAYAAGSKQGGFIYSTSENKDKVGSGESKAKTIEESMDDGTKVSRLRAYGSMTYVGFKSYVYANLKKDDKRVTEAMRWIRENYTLAENPGMGAEGTYYYFVTFAKALRAWGEPVLDISPTAVKAATKDGQGPAAMRHIANWRHDLIDRLAELQNSDGSFKSLHDRWMENDPVLITAYALIAAETALKDEAAK